MALPKLSAQQGIVNPNGTPSSPFLEFMEQARTAQEATDARQDAVDVELAAINATQDGLIDSLQDQIDRINRILAGTESFTGLNVGGVNVKPFLDKTDGTKLVTSGGIATGYVGTTTLATTAIRPGAPVTNAALVSVNGLNAVGGNVNAAGATTVVSATFTAPEAGNIIIRFTASLEITNAETCELAMFIDYSGTHSMQAIRDVEGVDPTRYREIVQNDPGGDSSSAQIVTTQSLSAGSHTVLILAMAKLDAGEIIVPAGGGAIEVFVR